MKKNFKKVSAVLMIAAATTFSMTSCGGGMTEAEAEAAAEEMLKDLDAAVEGATTEEEKPCEDGKCEEGKCGGDVESESTHTCEEGKCEEGKCGDDMGGDEEATEEAAE